MKFVLIFLLFFSGEPQGKDGNQKIRDTCKKYLDRVEELQEYHLNKEVITLHFISLLPAMMKHKLCFILLMVGVNI